MSLHQRLGIGGRRGHGGQRRVDPLFTSTIILFTVAMVSLIVAMKSAMSNGSRLWIVPVGDRRRGVGPGLDLDELVADQAVVLNRGDRIEPDQRVQVAPDPHPDPEPARRPGRHLDLSTSPASMPATRTLAPFSSPATCLNSA